MVNCCKCGSDRLICRIIRQFEAVFQIVMLRSSRRCGV